MSEQKLNPLTRFAHRLGIYGRGDIQKAKSEWREIAKQQETRRVPQIDFYTDTGMEHIIEPGYDYRSLVMLSMGNEVLRTVQEAIIKEANRNRWASHPKFTCKCKACGYEYANPKEKCSNSNCEGTDFIYPDVTQKQVLDAFLADPNADDEMKDIIESLMRYMLAVDDHWLSVQPPSIEKLTPLTIYVEDSIYMKVASDNYGRIGNNAWFCPVCTRLDPAKTYRKGERCSVHPDLELKETAYVYAEGSDVKARFSKDEVYHGKISPWLPGFYGNSKIISALRIILSITASDKKNLDEYTTGRVKQILAASGMSQRQANEMIAAALEQPKFKLEINPQTGDRVVKDMQLVLGLGSGTKLESLPGMPDSGKMQSLEWWKLWRETVCSIYGVTEVFVGANESGRTGNNPRMQIDVQNNTTELYHRAVEDIFDNFICPKLGVYDWIFRFNPVEEKDEMQDVTILNAKLDAMAKAVNLGLKAELTDEGEVKVSGEPLSLKEKQEMQMEQLEASQALKMGQNMPKTGEKPPKTQDDSRGTGFKNEKPFTQEKAKSDTWIVKKVSGEVNET